MSNGFLVVEMQLSPSTVLKIQRYEVNEWCHWSVDGSSDAIVNYANEQMLGGGGPDAAIHQAAGPELLAACYAVKEVRPGIRCPTGEARITPGFQTLLHEICYCKSCMLVARENNIQYIAFPAISCGVFRYPCDEATTISISTVKEFVDNNIKEVHFGLFQDEHYDAWIKKANELLQN